MVVWRGRCWLPGILIVVGCEGGGAASHLDAPPWRVTGPEIRIGSVDDPAYAFSYVRALAVGPDGTAYTLHRNEGAVRVWSPDGQPVDTIGGKGDGPGEFQTPFALGFFGDTLWVMDLRAYRASYFTADGEFLGTAAPLVDIGGTLAASPPRPERPLRDGTWYGVSPAWSDGIARGTLTETPHVHMDTAGAVLDTTWVQHQRKTDILALLRKDGPGGTYFSQPFSDTPRLQVLNDGSAVVAQFRVPERAEGATLSVMRVTASGDTIWRTELPYTPVPLDPARADSSAEAIAAASFQFFSRVRSGATESGLAEEVRDAMYVPAFEPFLEGLAVAADGSVWLKRYGATPDGAEWWILDAQGEPLGRAMTPAGLRVLAIHGDEIWGVETDDLDVNYIVRYRVDRGMP